MTKAPAAKAAPTKKRRAISLEKKKARAGWLFILPFVIGFLLVYLPIIVDSISYSFNYVDRKTGALEFAGFEIYQKALFDDTGFLETLVSGLGSLAFDIPAIVIFSLFMAVLLNKKMFGRAAFRAIFFIPVIISTGIIAEIDANNILQNYMGGGGMVDDGSGSSSEMSEMLAFTDLTWLFENMQIGTELLDYVVSIVNNIYGIINRSGVQMLIFLAGLQSVSPAIYESCSIDGASGWETFWKITFPMVSPMILVNAIYTVIDSFTAESNTVMNYINTIYNGGNREVATAMSWVYFLIVIAIIAVVALALSAYIFYQKRD